MNIDPVIAKRFLKYNRSLVAVLCVSLVLVLFLLVISILKYIDMIHANNEVNKMRNTISDLQDPNRNQVAVIAGNLDLLKQDYVIYHAKNQEMRPFFGQPYKKPLDLMAKQMGWKDSDDLITKFYAYLNENSREPFYARWTRFQMQHGEKWKQAMDVFAAEAQKVSFEKITAANRDDIFLQAVGLPREMSGRSLEFCQDIIKNADINLNKLILDRNVDINQDAVEFSLLTPGLNTPAQIAESMQNMEIVGDMMRRFIAKVPSDRQVKYMRVLDRVKYNGRSRYNEDQKIEVYKYNIKFIGTMDSVRDITFALNNAMLENRVYVVRNLKMSVPPEEDSAAVILGMVEAPVMRDKDGKVIEIKFKDDSHLPYNQRRDYGKVMIGKSPFFEVEMDIDYMILKQHEYQNR